MYHLVIAVRIAPVDKDYGIKTDKQFRLHALCKIKSRMIAAFNSSNVQF